MCWVFPSPAPSQVGASEAGRANLTKTILLLEKAIEDHNDAVHLNEGMARITVIERLLRWPSAVDNSPKVRAAGGHGSLVVRRLSGIHPVNTFTRTGGWPAVAMRYDVSLKPPFPLFGFGSPSSLTRRLPLLQPSGVRLACTSEAAVLPAQRPAAEPGVLPGRTDAGRTPHQAGVLLRGLADDCASQRQTVEAAVGVPHR